MTIDPNRQKIQRADWVTVVGSPTIVGTVWRLARDGSWADVHWRHGNKRMPTGKLIPQSYLTFGNWRIVDELREREMEAEAQR
jgi:hypothetical protein